ncbi:hypothetical protein AGDE_13809 [Angomonas deanei]|uniref:Protein kinase domain-containing protein n=1 Tax=Angomonas deanei TaxID=59799 RepID=A0A7G2CU78_9TRYP|nr:hypothetical protein AGDE_13809 [Angomonas deanei]CAD2222849.1 hypothetical protein, conserved [Angomonas deanei]|eukprot:EPY21747.1 hypothetical protein AGDE_13809 [Angomonas deanei]
MPPELYARREDLEALGPPAEIEKRKMVNVYALDVWSLGITFLSLLTGEIPFHSLNQIRSVLTKGFQLPSSVPAEWVPVLSAMTHPNQHRRADMRTVRKMLKEMEEKQIKSVRAIPSTKSIPTKNLDIKFSTIKMTNEDDAVLTSMLGTMYNNDEMHPKRNVENSFVTFGKEMGEDSVRCSYSNVHQKGRAADTGSGGNSAVRGGPVLVRQASTGTPLLPNVRTPATIGGKLNPWHNPSISQSQISLESNDFDGRNRRAQALMDAVKLKLT